MRAGKTAHNLGSMADVVIPHSNTPAERASAAVTTAEAALARDWTRDDLVDVLGALGLTDRAVS